MAETKGRQLRKEAVENLRTKITESKSVVFTEYHGLTASQISDLRSKLRDLGAEASVAKNTLLTLALDHPNIDLKGPTLAVFSYTDAVAAIKTIFDFAKDNEDKPLIKGGLVEGRFTNTQELETLSKLPGRDQLLAQVVGGLKSPLSGMVGVLNGVQRNFVYALSEIAKTKA